MKEIFFNFDFRYHPACVDMTTEDAQKLEQYVCSECS